MSNSSPPGENPSAARGKPAGWFFIAIAVAVAADQIIKFAVETYLPLQQAVPMLPFLALYRTYNEGIAFSMLAGVGDTVLVLITLAIIGAVLMLWRSTATARWLAHLGYAMIIAGALGNLIDRVLLGHVIDYVLFHTPVWSFAVFNLADAFISLGAASILIDEFFMQPRKERRLDAQGKD